MPPVADILTGFSAGFEYPNGYAAIDQVRGGGKAYGAGSDYGDRQFFTHGRSPAIFLEASKYDAKKNLCRVALATFFDAAFFGQVRDKAVHHRIVGPANECGRLPFLRDKPDLDQLLQMMG